VVVHICNSNTQEAESGGFEFHASLGHCLKNKQINMHPFKKKNNQKNFQLISSLPPVPPYNQFANRSYSDPLNVI
jgi:hypothetical protein